MVRSNWKKALVLTFAWASLALALEPLTSSAPATKPELSPGQTFTVQEPGKAGQKCKVLKTWKTPEGKTAYQVRSMTSGEMLTIVETGAGPNLPSYPAGNGPRFQAVATRIFHWGSNQTPPPGTPMPPVESIQTLPGAKPRLEPAYTTTMPQPYPSKPTAPPAWEITRPPAPIVTEQPEKPGFFARLFPWARRSQDATTQVTPPQYTQYTIPGSVPLTRQATTPSNATSAFPGPASPRITDGRFPISTQGVLPQTNNSSSTSSSQTKTTTPGSWFGSTTTIQPKTSIQDQPKTSLQDTWITQSKPASQATTAFEDKSSSTQPKTATPDNRFISTPITQPSTTFQNRWLIPPQATPQEKSSVTPPAPGSTSPSPYFPTSPIDASRGTPQTSITPQRVVQVIPPSTGITSQSPSTYTIPPAPPKTAPTISNMAWPKPTVPAYTPITPTSPKASATASSPAWSTTSTPPPTTPTQNLPKNSATTPSPAWTVPTTPTPSPSTQTLPKTSAAPPSPAWSTPATPTSATSPLTMPKSSATAPSPAWPTPTVPKATTITPAQPKTTPLNPTWPALNTPTPMTITPTPVKPAAMTPITPWPTPTGQSQASTIYKPTVSTLNPYYPVAPTYPSTSGAKGAVTSSQSTIPATASKPASVTPAPPTDWRQSWGKMNDTTVPTATKPAQSLTESYLPPIKPVLPQADTKRPDPLQMPEQFNRSPVETKPQSQKSDTRLVPAAAVASATTMKPAVPSTAMPAPVSSSTDSMRVPLGAQSVIQAGDPGPGGVRYIPVPMVTIPDIKRAPVPPMNNPAPLYGTPSGMAAGTNANQTNAFTPAPSRQSFAQATNAFGSSAAVVNAPYGQSMMRTGSTDRMAQAVPPFGSTNLMNSGVVSTGFQGSGFSNAVVPASFHTMTYEPLTPTAHLTPVMPTADNIHQMQATLRDSLYPSQREWAAESMAAVDWRTHPQVVQALTTAAREDPAPTVRASCVRCLAAMKVNTLPVINVVRGLENDSDPRVRQEAERAWSVLTAGEK